MIQINRVAVLGAGVMGATIAAHLANSGLEVLMLDIVPKDLTEAESKKGLTLKDSAVRNRIAVEALKGLSTMKPSPLYLPALIDRIEVGNFDDDLEKCADCDWIIEVVVEYLPIKIELLQKITPFLKENTVLTTNTSGLSVNEMAEALPDFFRRRFLATHFFNPPCEVSGNDVKHQNLQPAVGKMRCNRCAHNTRPEHRYPIYLYHACSPLVVRER